VANPPTNRNANDDELRDARRMLTEAQRDTKYNGERIDALVRHVRAEQRQVAPVKRDSRR